MTMALGILAIVASVLMADRSPRGIAPGLVAALGVGAIIFSAT